MNKQEKESFRKQLQELGKRIHATALSAEEQARAATGGDATGDLSSTPMHLGDVGSEAYDQELGATLLANEQYIETEILAALERIEKGSYGQCENCNKPIARERLKALPYARHCVSCASKLQEAPEVNLNDGRPKNWADGIGLRSEVSPTAVPEGPNQFARTPNDIHAAGTPGGGSAIGGLAGTTVGIGDPDEDEDELEEAMGSGNFDATLAERTVGEETEEEEVTDAYSGPTGGAVGGTPANKRARGGRTAPQEGSSDGKTRPQSGSQRNKKTSRK